MAGRPKKTHWLVEVFLFFCLGSFLETRGDWWVEIAEISFIMKVISEMSTWNIAWFSTQLSYGFSMILFMWKSCTSWYVVYPNDLQGFWHPRWCRISSINSMCESPMVIFAWNGCCELDLWQVKIIVLKKLRKVLSSLPHIFLSFGGWWWLGDWFLRHSKIEIILICMFVVICLIKGKYCV